MTMNILFTMSRNNEILKEQPHQDVKLFTTCDESFVIVYANDSELWVTGIDDWNYDVVSNTLEFSCHPDNVYLEVT